MRTVRLLHWNILYTEKAENILDLIDELKPDIFSCQEISDKNANSKKVLDGLKDRFKSVCFEPADIIGKSGELLQLGNAVAANFPITDRRRIDLWDSPNPTSGNQKEQRIYIEAGLDVDGRKIAVGSTHLSFAPYFADTPDRLEQARKLMAAISKHKSGFVITGDFNSAPDTKIIKDMENLFSSAGPSHRQPTFTTIPFEYLDFEVKGLEWRVDYIFASPDIKVLSSKIIPTKYSDHLPILAEIQIST